MAILVHDVDQPSRAVYYPFAEFSPEWQAMRWAVSAKVPVRFMDLPQWHRMPVEAERVKEFIAKVEQERHRREGEEPTGEESGDDAGPAH